VLNFFVFFSVVRMFVSYDSKLMEKITHRSIVFYCQMTSHYDVITEKSCVYVQN